MENLEMFHRRITHCVIFIAALQVFRLALPAFQASSTDSVREAQRELFAARYPHAAELYSKILDENPLQSDAYYGLVRALVRGHRAAEAYTAADRAMDHVPQTPGALAAAGLATYRRGDLAKSEEFFRAALKLNPRYADALVGLSSIYSAVSRFKSARELLLDAYRYSPDDPALMLVYANTLHGAEHLEALQRVLKIYDPDSREARGLRAHIASDQALAERKLRRLTSPYEPARVKLVRLMDGPNRMRGVGVRVRFNRQQTVTLLLDTGASGVSLSPKAAEKSGLELLSAQTTEMNGIGNDRSQDSFHYVAPEIQVGDIVFADYPISVFKSAKASDFDGLIGADVFQRFIVSIDFPGLELSLDPRPKTEVSPGEDPEDANPLAPGFQRALRFGNHLTVPTSVNQHPARLFREFPARLRDCG